MIVNEYTQEIMNLETLSQKEGASHHPTQPKSIITVRSIIVKKHVAPRKGSFKCIRRRIGAVIQAHIVVIRWTAVFIPDKETVTCAIKCVSARSTHQDPWQNTYRRK